MSCQGLVRLGWVRLGEKKRGGGVGEADGMDGLPRH